MDDYKVRVPATDKRIPLNVRIVSYLWVLETNTGATWRTGYLRIVRPIGR